MTVVDFEMVKTQYLMDIKMITEIDRIPKEVIIISNQTSVEYVPVSSWTNMAPQVSEKITNFKLLLCLLLCFLVTFNIVTFPLDWNVTFSNNHWSNENQKEERVKH
jgi:hypothetical protein